MKKLNKVFLINIAIVLLLFAILINLFLLIVYVPNNIILKKNLSDPITMTNTNVNANTSQYDPILIYDNQGRNIFWVSVDKNQNVRLNYELNNETPILIYLSYQKYIENLQVLLIGGKFHIIWDQGSNNIWSVFYVNGSSENWNTPLKLSNSSWSIDPTFQVDHSGYLHFVWTEFYQIGPSFNSFQLFYKNLSIVKNLWSQTFWFTKEMVDSRHLDNNFEPNINIDNANNIFVIWRYQYGSASEIRLRYFNTTIWSDSFPITQSNIENVFSPILLFDRDWNLKFYWIKYVSDNMGQIYTMSYLRKDQIWSREYLLRNISAQLDLYYWMKFAFSPSTNITFITWTEYNNSKVQSYWGEIYNNQINYSSLIKISNEDITDPFISMYNKTIFLSWVDYSSGNGIIFQSEIVSFYESKQNYNLLQIWLNLIFLIVIIAVLLIVNAQSIRKIFLSKDKTDLNYQLIDDIVDLRSSLNIIFNSKLNFNLINSNDILVTSIRKTPLSESEFNNNLSALASYIEELNITRMKEEIEKRIVKKTNSKIYIQALSNDILKESNNKIETGNISINGLEILIKIIIYPRNISIPKIRAIRSMRNNPPTHPRYNENIMKNYSIFSIKYPLEKRKFGENWINC